MSEQKKCDCGKCLLCDFAALQAYPAKWKRLKNPLAAVEAIRNGDDYDLDEWLEREAEESKKSE